jgi:hypothetical protein
MTTYFSYIAQRALSSKGPAAVIRPWGFNFISFYFARKQKRFLYFSRADAVFFR